MVLKFIACGKVLFLYFWWGSPEQWTISFLLCFSPFSFVLIGWYLKSVIVPTLFCQFITKQYWAKMMLPKHNHCSWWVFGLKNTFFIRIGFYLNGRNKCLWFSFKQQWTHSETLRYALHALHVDLFVFRNKELGSRLQFHFKTIVSRNDIPEVRAKHRHRF